MIIEFSKKQIQKDERNRVTSSDIYKKYQRVSNRFKKFDPNGIFSDQIFGRIGRCKCEEHPLVLRPGQSEGYCDKCDCRVVRYDKIPDYYVDLGADFPILHANFQKTQNPKQVEQLLTYVAFEYDGQVIPFDANDPDLDISIYDANRVHIGSDAVLLLGLADQDWLDDQVVDFVSIPHPIYRPLIPLNDNKTSTAGINDAYLHLIKAINHLQSFDKYIRDNPFMRMAQYQAVYHQYMEVLDEIYTVLGKNKFCTVKNELLAHPVSGAARGVLINRWDVHEDVLLVGDTMIRTLFPYLFQKYNGDLYEINKHFVENDCMVLLNRAPTISALSIFGMRPRVASLYPVGQTEGTDRCLGLPQKEVHYRHDPEYEWFDLGVYGCGYEDGGAEAGWDGDRFGVFCLGSNPITHDALGADTDGDVLIVIALYSNAAVEEARTMVPSLNYMNFPNETIRNAIMEDWFYNQP